MIAGLLVVACIAASICTRTAEAAWVYHRHVVQDALAARIEVTKHVDKSNKGTPPAQPPGFDNHFAIGQRCPARGERGGPYRALVKFPMDTLASLDIARAEVKISLRRYDFKSETVEVHRLAGDFDKAVTPSNAPARTSDVALATADVSDSVRGVWTDVALNVTQNLIHDVERGYGTFAVSLSGDEANCFTRSALKSSASLVITHQTDGTPPEATLVGAPRSPSASAESRLSFVGSDEESGVSHFECSLDGGDYLPCTSPWRYLSLLDGTHTFDVRAVDRAGNVGTPSSATPWIVDTSAPVVSIYSAPVAKSDSASATFAFTFSDPKPVDGDGATSGVASVRCQLDGGALSRCSSPMTYTGLTEGEHTFVVHVTDEANNTGVSNVHTWTVDLPPAVALELVVDAEEAPSRGVGRNAAAARAAKRRGAGRDARIVRGEFTVRVAWSELVHNFDEADIQLTGAAAEILSLSVDKKSPGPGTVYVLAMKPRSSGTLTISVPADSAKDANGRANPLPAPSLTVTCDLDAPVARIVGEPAIADGAFIATFAWNEAVFGFDPTNEALFAGLPVTVEEVMKGGNQAAPSATSFSVRIVPKSVGTLKILVPKDVAQDAAGNANAAMDSAASIQVVSGTSFVLSREEKGQTRVRRFTAGLDALGDAQILPINLADDAVSTATVDRTGRLLIADAATSSIQFFGADLSPDATLHGFANVSSIAIDEASGVIFVAHGAGDAHGIWAVNATTGETLNRIDVDATSASGDDDDEDTKPVRLHHADALAFDGSSTLYALDAKQGVALAFLTQAGAAAGASRFTNESSFAHPKAIEVDGDGYVYVADGDRVHIFARNGKLAGMIDASALPKGGTFRPVSLAMDRHARLLVGNNAKASALVFRKLHPRAPATTYVSALPSGSGNVAAVSVYRERAPPDASLKLMQDAATTSMEVSSSGDGSLPTVHGEFDVAVTWSKPVTNFSANALKIGGAGGSVLEVVPLDTPAMDNDADGEIDEDDGIPRKSFRVRVAPAGVGVVIVGVHPSTVVDVDGNTNVESSSSSSSSLVSASASSEAATSELRTVFYGGECSVTLGCQWQLTEYEHELAARRVSLEVDSRIRLEKEKLAIQHAADARRDAQRHAAEEKLEAMRHEAALAKAQIERETLAEKARLEEEARVREAKATQSLELEKIVARGAAARDTAIAAVGHTLSMLGEGANALLGDPTKLRNAAILLACIFFGYFAAREIASALAEVMRRVLGQPRLVRASSRFHLSSLLPGFVRRIFASSKPPPAVISGDEPDIVLSDSVAAKVNAIGYAVHACHTRGTALRNVLFFGAPGTGKTLVAERLARTAGLDYALMSGGDVAPLGEKAVTELHRVFDWAARSPRGVLIFVDEADAFLKRRVDEAHAAPGGDASHSGSRAAVNAFLARTSSQSTRVMLVLATNRPHDLDAAVLDRVDATIEFPMPGAVERSRLLRWGLTRDLGTPETNGDGKSIKCFVPRRPSGLRSILARRQPDIMAVGGLNWAHVDAAASQLGGWSGRGIAKLCSALALAVFGRHTDDGRLADALTISPSDFDILIKEKSEEARHLSLFDKHSRESFLFPLKSNGNGH